MARVATMLNRLTDVACFAWRLGGVALMGVNVVAADYLSRHWRLNTFRSWYNQPTSDQLDRFERLDACEWVPWVLAGYALVGACIFARRGRPVVYWCGGLAGAAVVCWLLAGLRMP